MKGVNSSKLLLKQKSQQPSEWKIRLQNWLF